MTGADGFDSAGLLTEPNTFELLGAVVDSADLLIEPNMFDEPLRARLGRGGWQDVPYRSRGSREVRGLGLDDLVDAIATGREPRASGRLALITYTIFLGSSTKSANVINAR